MNFTAEIRGQCIMKKVTETDFLDTRSYIH